MKTKTTAEMFPGMKLTGRNFVSAFRSSNGKGTELYVTKFFDRMTAEFSCFQVGVSCPAARVNDSEFADTPAEAVRLLKKFAYNQHLYGVEVDISGANAEALEDVTMPVYGKESK